MILGIQDIAYHLPTGIRTNESICATHDFDETFIANKLGIRSRHVAAENEPTSDLCAGAVTQLLASTAVDPSDIELLIVVTQTPDFCLPHTAALVHQRLGFSKNVAAFDISLGCSGYVYGLHAALGFMNSSGMRLGILVTGEEYTKVVDPADRATAPLFGDGASATLISNSPIYTIGKTTFGTDGSLNEALIVPGSGVHQGGSGQLHMDGRQIFNFMMTEVPKDVDACLAKNERTAEEIDLWVFHQASKYMLEALGKRLKIPSERIAVDMEDTGNTTSSTIPIVLKRRMMADREPPKRALLSGFGVGLSWASTILELQE